MKRNVCPKMKLDTCFQFRGEAFGFSGISGGGVGGKETYSRQAYTYKTKYSILHTIHKRVLKNCSSFTAGTLTTYSAPSPFIQTNTSNYYRISEYNNISGGLTIV